MNDVRVAVIRFDREQCAHAVRVAVLREALTQRVPSREEWFDRALFATWTHEAQEARG